MSNKEKPIELDFTRIAQSHWEYEKIAKIVESNDQLAELYQGMADFSAPEGNGNVFDNAEWAEYNKFVKKASSVRYCNKQMFFDWYKKNNIKDFISTFYCRDRFCTICAERVSNTRAMRFKKILDDFSKTYDIYHLSMTLPNARGLTPINSKQWGMPALDKHIVLMASRFNKFIRYFKGATKIAGIDFLKFGYKGATRSLEIVQKKGNLYHPHYHCIMLLKKGLKLSATGEFGQNINDFSYSYRTKDVTKFTDLEILIQKIWYLIINNHKVTMFPPKAVKLDADGKGIKVPSIKTIKQGYSCRLVKVEDGKYHEAFKYTIKPDKDLKITGSVFSDLYHSLYMKKTLEPYGIFRNIPKDMFDEVPDDEFDTVYDNIIAYLKAQETPVQVSESPAQARDNIKAKKAIYINRKTLRSFVIKHGLDDSIKLLSKEPERTPEFAQLVFDLSKIKKADRVNEAELLEKYGKDYKKFVNLPKQKNFDGLKVEVYNPATIINAYKTDEQIQQEFDEIF